MTTEPIHFDPEVETLLRQIAADPDSSLLRVTRPQSVKGLFERTERVSPWMTGLASVERELVRVHRHEVAYLLREACRWRMLTDASIGDKVCPFDADGTRYSSSPPKADNVGEPWVEDSEAHEGIRLFERCVGGGEGVPPTSSLALAAHRLEPSGSARMYMALDLTMRNRPRSALRVNRQLLAENVDPTIRFLSLSNAGQVCQMLSKPRQMLECLSSSARTTEHPLPCFEWLFESLRFEGKRETFEAARSAETAIGEHPAAFRWYQEMLADRRAKGTWQPTPSQQRFARDILGSLPRGCRRMVDEFA